MIKPWLSLSPSPMARFYRDAFAYSTALCRALSVPALHAGILQLPKHEQDIQRFARAPGHAGWDSADLAYLTPQEASAIVGTEVTTHALHWKSASVIDPAAWVKVLLGTAPVWAGQRISRLHRSNEHWRCETDEEVFQARHLWCATGAALAGITAAGFPAPSNLRPRAGQLSFVPAGDLPLIHTTLSYGDYWIPARGEQDFHILGATFERSSTPSLNPLSHQKNLQALQAMTQWLPEVRAAAMALSPLAWTGRAAVRMTTPNHLPVWGRLGDGMLFLNGLGARGLMSAPYAAHLAVNDLT